ncbi:MAG: hypothetical protein K0S65_980 [Labilithrix sp.]|nr:hypothetical protein [Labilithrix sp.]
MGATHRRDKGEATPTHSEHHANLRDARPIIHPSSRDAVNGVIMDEGLMIWRDRRMIRVVRGRP